MSAWQYLAQPLSQSVRSLSRMSNLSVRSMKYSVRAWIIAVTLSGVNSRACSLVTPAKTRCNLRLFRLARKVVLPVMAKLLSMGFDVTSISLRRVIILRRSGCRRRGVSFKELWRQSKVRINRFVIIKLSFKVSRRWIIRSFIVLSRAWIGVGWISSRFFDNLLVRLWRVWLGPIMVATLWWGSLMALALVLARSINSFAHYIIWLTHRVFLRFRAKCGWQPLPRLINSFLGHYTLLSWWEGFLVFRGNFIRLLRIKCLWTFFVVNHLFRLCSAISIWQLGLIRMSLLRLCFFLH